MRLLDRYLLRELLIPLVYCLGGFLIFWVTFDLFAQLGDLREHFMTGMDIAQYYCVKTPEFLVLVLPIALLLAMLYALSNHSRYNEITAIRTAGVSLWRLALPYFGVGLFCSGLLFILNELWVPDSAEASEAIHSRRVPRLPGASPPNQVRNFGFTNNRDGRLWRIGVFDLQTAQMINPQVIWKRPDGTRYWLYAGRAIRTNNFWTFYEVREYAEGARSNAMLVPIRQTNVLTVPQFSETPDQIRNWIKINNRMTLRAARRPDIPLLEIFDYLRLNPNPERSEDGAWLYTKLHGRLAAPWTCIVVVLIALPFGAASGRRNVFVGVASSIVICFGYFVLQQFCLALGSGGYLPPWAAGWLPNAAFGSVGLWLTSRVR
jgi:lipopolysaccharide export system permease protein